jgi:hypothetical protein
VQAGESFNFFVQTTEGGAFTQLGGVITNTCSFPGGSVAGTDLCRWDAPAGQTRFGVAVHFIRSSSFEQCAARYDCKWLNYFALLVLEM